MTFDEIAIGDAFDLGTHRFTAEEIKRFAGAYDPQPFHLDEADAAASPFGALCASGWHTAAVMMRLQVAYFRRHAEQAAARGNPPPPLGPSPGFDDLKWLKPVFAGDTIAFASRIVGKRAARSRPGWGIVSIETTGTKLSGEPAFQITGHVFMAMARTG